MIAGDRAGAGDGRAAGVAGGDQAGGPGVGDQRRVVVGGRDRTETGLRKPHTFLRQFLEIIGFEARLQDHRTGNDFHPARPVVRKAALRRDRQRLDAFGIARPARHMHFGGRDRRGDAAVQIAFQITHGALARRVVAKRDMHV